MFSLTIWGETTVEAEPYKDEVHLNFNGKTWMGKDIGKIGYVNLKPADARELAKAIVKAAAIADMRAKAEAAAKAELTPELEEVLLADLGIPKEGA